MNAETTSQSAIPYYSLKDFTDRKPFKLREGQVIAVRKPLDWTSFNVVSYFRVAVRKQLGIKKIKVGHAGSLDPKATGILLLATGRATKCIERLMDGTKEYVAELKFGATTPSFDTEHEEDATFPYEHITEANLRSELQRMQGEQMQVPPLFSAISVNGKRAYHLARKGVEHSLPPKRILLGELELLDFHLPYARLRIVCSRGTYIRALARDLGTTMDSGAYLTALERTRVGQISIEDAFDIEALPDLIALSEISSE